MVSLKRRLIQLGSPKAQGEGAPQSCRTVRRGREKEVEPGRPASGQSRGGRGGSEARGRSRETMGRIGGCRVVGGSGERTRSPDPAGAVPAAARSESTR